MRLHTCTIIMMQIERATTNEQLQEVFSDEVVHEAAMACGVCKPISRLTTKDKQEILKLLCLCDVLFGSKSAVDRFVEGLEEVD